MVCTHALVVLVSGITHQFLAQTILSGAINRAKSDLALARLAFGLVVRSRVSAALQSLRDGFAALDLSPNRCSAPDQSDLVDRVAAGGYAG